MHRGRAVPLSRERRQRERIRELERELAVAKEVNEVLAAAFAGLVAEQRAVDVASQQRTKPNRSHLRLV